MLLNSESWLSVFFLSLLTASHNVIAHQAQNRGWRVAEKTLCWLALAGGWLGGGLACALLRHKTYKTSFQAPFFAAAVANFLLAFFVMR